MQTAFKTLVLFCLKKTNSREKELRQQYYGITVIEQRQHVHLISFLQACRIEIIEL